MTNFAVCLNAVLPIFLLMALGYAAKCLGLLDRPAVATFNRAIYKFFFPAMTFYNLYTSNLSSAVRPWLMLYAVLAVLVSFFLALLFARRFVAERNQRGVVVQGIYRSNMAVIGLAIVGSLMGDTDLGPVAMVMALVVPLFNALAVIVLEYYGGSRADPKKIVLDILKNPLILGTAAGILALAVGLRLPSALESVVRQLSQATSPLVLFLLGAFFEFRGIRQSLRELIWVCLGRLVVVPGLFLGLGALLGFRGVEFAALVGVFASSTAAASFTMAQQMGGDATLAGNIVVATSVLCSVTMFLWCFLFKSLGFF